VTRREVLALISAAGVRALAADQNKASDPILLAMQDELERSRSLQITNLDKPYFIEYVVNVNRGFSVTASLGAIVNVSPTRFRIPNVRVRVGDPKFDNANYAYSDFYAGSRYDPDQLPLDDDYAVFRRTLWLATDRAYKTAVEAIGRKRAAIKSQNVGEMLPDFWNAEPVQMIQPISAAPPDQQHWVKRIREWSEIFADYPDIIGSTVQFSSGVGARYLVNTEGTRVRVAESLTTLQVRARAYATDGTQVRDAISIEAEDVSGLPKDDEIARAIKGVAENVRALAGAKAGESYSGPILFEGVAGPQIIAEVLARELWAPRRPLGDPGSRPVPFRASDLERRVGSRILPESFDIVDDPTRTKWEGIRLIGDYPIDEEGVVPKPLPVVDKGVLKNLLLTRQPIAGFNASNGRARLPGSFGTKTAGYSNLLISASEAVSGSDLRKKLLELCKARNLAYGMIVRKMDYPTSASLDEIRRIVANFQQSGGAGRPVSLPILAYRIYPDGREELVRGLQFRGFDVRSLRDIAGASKERHHFHLLNNLAPFALMGAGGFVAPSSVVGPSLLFNDVELETTREDQQKLPLVPPPSLSNA
jgi:TldD protein